MRESYDLSLGPHTVRIEQLSAPDATTAMDILLSALGSPLLTALLAGVKPGTGVDGALSADIDLAQLKLAWPAEHPGLARVRDLYTASAKMRAPPTAGVAEEVWFPLSACTQKVFDGHPGLRMRFDALCTRANFADFFSDLLSGGLSIRKV
jgi:hypothetical protein